MAWLLKKNQPSIVVGIISIAGLLLIIVLGAKVYSLALKGRAEKERIDQTTYQAVFLQDDQIYFGKLKGIDSAYPILEDVYYVKIEGDEAATGRLVKLGATEPHGPYDQMIINRDHILFWENLKPDSRIIQTINALKISQ